MTYTFYKNRIDQIRNRWAWMTVRVVHAFYLLSSICIFTYITDNFDIFYSLKTKKCNDKRID